MSRCASPAHGIKLGDWQAKGMSDQAGDGVRTEIAQIIEALETGK